METRTSVGHEGEAGEGGGKESLSGRGKGGGVAGVEGEDCEPVVSGAEQGKRGEAAPGPLGFETRQGEHGLDEHREDDALHQQKIVRLKSEIIRHSRTRSMFTPAGWAWLNPRRIGPVWGF